MYPVRSIAVGLVSFVACLALSYLIPVLAQLPARQYRLVLHNQNVQVLAPQDASLTKGILGPQSQCCNSTNLPCSSCNTEHELSSAGLEFCRVVAGAFGGIWPGAKNTADFLQKIWPADEGQDVAEYAIMLAVILALAIGTVQAMSACHQRIL